MRPSTFPLLLAALLAPSRAGAASLDVGTSYRMRAVSYTNLNLQEPPNEHSFITQNAGLSVFVRNIQMSGLELLRETGDTTMDVGISLRGVGVAGSSTALQAPFTQIGAQYPNTTFTPFIENVYAQANELFGWPVNLTVGRQPFVWGSGLLIADDIDKVHCAILGGVIVLKGSGNCIGNGSGNVKYCSEVIDLQVNQASGKTDAFAIASWW